MRSKASLLRVELLLVISFFLTGCGNSTEPPDLAGLWKFVFNVEGNELPFNAEIIEEDGKAIFYAINGKERIRAEHFLITKDSIRIQLPIFNTELAGRIDSEGSIKGQFYDHSRKGSYKIGFTATKDVSTRFAVSQPPTVDVTGKWRVEFSPGSDHEYLAIGDFRQEGNKAFGTFLTTTGDYRFLEGNVSGDSLLLSCFDGSHVFLFKAKVTGEGIEGDFWSGNHWIENWVGTRNEEFELPDANSLTFLKSGYSKIDFSFSNMDGKMVSLSDDRFTDKVVIVQIMGSWCPNCKDETAYLVSLYNKLHDQGLEVISLAFEKSDNAETNLRSLKRLKDHFNVPYPILLAGKANKTEAAKKLPMLNHVLSFPTSIYIDRKGEVRRIHTGFSGPGTGEYYSEFVEETNRFVTQLLIE